MNESGVLQGGWGYVIAVYAISAVVYAAYAYSVIRRESRSRSKEATR